MAGDIERRVSDIADSIKESVPYRAAEVLTGPLVSGFMFTLHKKFGGRLTPQLAEYFGPYQEGEQKKHKDLSSFLATVDLKLAGNYSSEDPHYQKEGTGAPQEFIGQEDFMTWKTEKMRVEKELGIQLTDYVLTDGGTGKSILFGQEDNSLVPIFVEGNSAMLGRYQEREESLSEFISQEVAIYKIARDLSIKPEDVRLRRMTSVTNDFDLRRHSDFEREGDMFESLRKQGVIHIGELQTVSRLITTYGLRFEYNRVLFANQLGGVWLDTYIKADSDHNSEAGKLKSGLEALGSFTTQVFYYQLVKQYYRENPDLVLHFMESGIYLKHRRNFEDIHINAKGQTEFQKALEMLANYYLASFEGEIETSPSQKYMKGKLVFYGDLDRFVSRNFRHALNPDLKLADLVRKVKSNPFNTRILSQSAYEASVLDAKQSLKKADHEIKRHKATRKLLDWIHRESSFDLIDNEDRSLKIFRVLIGNLGLVKVPGEGRYTLTSYFSKTPYWPEGFTVTPYQCEDASCNNVSDSLRHVFNGQVFSVDHDTPSAYESQVARIYTEGSTIYNFLSSDESVPYEVRKFISTLSQEDLGMKILERFGCISDQDPQIVSTFFREGFEEFRTMTIHRYVTDFVRGVESNLIILTGNRFSKIKRTWVHNWRNYDFSQVPEQVLNQAIKMTLETADHRIKLLNHEISERKTPKDMQEMLEKFFGWNTYDMSFLRWERFWNIWNTLGGAWDCVCFIRKPVFNPQTIRQF